MKPMILWLALASAVGLPTINTAVAGLPVRSVLANGSRTDMYLIGSKEIRSLEELRGKKVASGGIGGLADVGTRRFLSAKGIDPKEITFIVLGSSSVRMAAVLSGTVAAAPLSPPHDYLAKKAGLKVLGYFGDAFPSYMGGVGIHLESLRSRPALVKGFVKASLKGLKFGKRFNYEEAYAWSMAKDVQLDYLAGKTWKEGVRQFKQGEVQPGLGTYKWNK